MIEPIVRAYEQRDIQAIIALERECAEAPQWGETFWSGGFPGDTALRGVLIAEVEEQVFGYAVISYAVGIAELEGVAVSESARRRGVGKKLCERAMQWARECGAKTIELEVRESNAAALSLYRRVGFVEQGKRPKYYRDPEEDAVLMAAIL